MVSKYSQFSEEKKEKMRLSHRKWAENNSRKEYYKAYDALRITPEKMMHRNAKSRSIKKNVPFEIEVTDIVMLENCPICGNKMCIGPKGGGPNSPTLDRIVPNKGYVKDNICVICKSCNSVKSDSTVERLRLILSYMEKNS